MFVVVTTAIIAVHVIVGAASCLLADKAVSAKWPADGSYGNTSYYSRAMRRSRILAAVFVTTSIGFIVYGFSNAVRWTILLGIFGGIGWLAMYAGIQNEEGHKEVHERAVRKNRKNH